MASGEGASVKCGYEPSLKNIMDQTSLKWIFVGGKGGVGKTTTSCSLAIQLCKVRDRVLIVSTDPAHNLSDAFSQKFTYKPSRVHGFSNLYALELDLDLQGPETPDEDWDYEEKLVEHTVKDLGEIIKESIHSLDEIFAFRKLVRLTKKMEYSVVVFDTAPSSYTLRMLSYGEMFHRMTEGLSKSTNFLAQFAPMASLLTGFLREQEQDALNTMLSNLKTGVGLNETILDQVVQHLKDSNHTTFVCVCLAEFSPLYETERLVQTLCRYGVESHNIVVNQLNLRPTLCATCSARSDIQKKYLQKIEELYEDFHVTKMPLMAKEIRGVEQLRTFSEYLLCPPSPDREGKSKVK